MAFQKKPLTPKQKIFCAAVAAGKTYAQAYNIAYPLEGIDGTGSDSPAAHAKRRYGYAMIVARAAVQEEIARLREKAAESLGWTRDLWVAELTDYMRRQKPESKARLAALVELGKALGFYDPVKVQVGPAGPSMVIKVLPPSPEERAEIEAAAKSVEVESKEIPVEPANVSSETTIIPSKNEIKNN